MSQAPMQDEKSVNIDALTHVMSQLAHVLLEEAKHVDVMDTEAIAALQEQKQSYIKTLEKQQKIFTKRGYANALTLQQRTELTELYEAFEAIASENQQRLGMARQANAHVIDALATSAKEQAGRSGYTQQGKRPDESNIAFSLNKSI